MKNSLPRIFVGMLCLIYSSLSAQVTDTNHYNYGIWQSFGNPIAKSTAPEIKGRLVNFRWADIEPSPNVWNWVAMDTAFASRSKDSLPIIFLVYTKQDAPDWLYSNGVPKVNEKDASGNITGWSPYYANAQYKSYFKRMIDSVFIHVTGLPDSIRSKIIAVQACFGSTGDYISYKGTVDAQYNLTANDFFILFKEFTQKYYDDYKNTNPKIYILSNPQNNGPNQMNWLTANTPGGWIKTGSLGKGFQLNDEVTKSSWLYPILNTPQNGNWVRARCEITGDGVNQGWWLKSPYKNMFTLMCYGIYWGLDWSNQDNNFILDHAFDSAFGIYNRYAGQKIPDQSVYAMCMLKDALDASDAVRFPASQYGTVAKTQNRFNNVLQPFIPYGAKLEDPANALLSEIFNLDATGTNDVGWGIFPGNYDRFLHQLNANATSAGYWNIYTADTTSMFGRFARGFDLAKGKDGLYFDLDSAFLSYAPLNAKYPVEVEITYLDSGYGKFQIYYDSKDDANKPSIQVSCNNTKTWKKISVALNDAYFGNRSVNGSDFYVKNAGTENVIFTLVELKRATSDFSNVGVIASPMAAFDTSCLNSVAQTKSVTVTGSFLDGSDVKIGPYPGCKFATTANGIYADSILLTGYGANFNIGLYTQVRTDSVADYSGIIPVMGGGDTLGINIVAVIVNSSPQLNPTIHNVSCYNAKDASIDLNPSDGTGPYTYSWKNTGFYKNTTEDINGLSPSDYTVTVTSYAGCATSATYTITQPDQLQATVIDDEMYCKNTTTTVHVTATGGTLPYIGTGDMAGISTGTATFTVTDANGCTDTRSTYVNNGVNVAPGKPGTISSPDADATGLCAGGDFSYSIAAVSTATSYTWSLPGGCSITSATSDSTGIMLNAPNSFSTGSLSVTANNVCGSSIASVKTITGAPGAPGAISGTSYVLPSQTGLVYSVPEIAGLTYTWTLPAGANILSGQNTSSINVKWGTNSGNVTVKANNSCGISTNTNLFVTVAGSTFVSTVDNFPQFDTVCANGMSSYKSFNLSASGLNGDNVTVGPVDGFKLSTSANGIYTDTVMYGGYGTTLNKLIYVKFAPGSVGAYNNSIPISGGGAAPLGIGASGISVNSSPALSANISNVTCNTYKNGSIDLVVNDGTGPFTYSWTGGFQPTYDAAAQDIAGLSPGTYTVSVTSYAGCKISSNFTITQPDALVASANEEPMYCKNSTTVVHVTGSGGTLPYSGIGDMPGYATGNATFTITDANGCSSTKTIYVNNGSNVAPAKPGTIIGADADATGICAGGSFSFSIDPVATANSYTWTGPNGSTVASSNSDGSQVVFNIPSGISSDSVRVTANNVCGASTAAVKTLSSTPGKPGAISGPAAVLPSQAGAVYSVPAVSGLAYKWTVPTGSTIVGSATGSTITVNWGTKAGNVTAKAQNSCGISLVSSLAVSVSSAVFVPSVSSLPTFDTTCVAGLSANKSFTFSVSGLSGAAVIVGPAAGFKFSTTTAGTYTDSLTLTGTAFTNQNVFVKFNPVNAGATNSTVSIRGGGAPSAASVALSGNALLSSPALSAAITNITCNGLKNGAIDLSLSGGTGPYTYNWTGTGTYDPSKQDISGLSAVNYTVTVTSYAGCTASATYTVTQPAAIVVSPVQDPMLCKNGTTTVNVTATGGTLPYTGTGAFPGISAGSKSFAVTDANGCAGTKSLTVANGAGLPPSKPIAINSAAADATGICGGGTFAFAIDPVSGATSYSWIPPSGSSIVTTSPDGTQVTIAIPAGKTTDSVRVAALNSCGTSGNFAKTITAAPAKTSAVSGPTAALPSQAGLTYSITAVSGLSYTWTVPTGASITSGANTATIIVKWGTKAGNVTVKAVNACGSSVVTSLAVTLANTAFSLSTTSLPAFDTACIGSLSANKSFTFSAAGLNGTNIVVGPLAGFKFSTTSAGTYSDSLILTGTAFTNQSVFVKFNPSVAKVYSGNVVIKGGGATAVSVAVSGVAVSSSPALSANITNITCSGLSNGAINLTTAGGTGPFTYNWTGGGAGATYTPTAEDISGLSASSYSITVTSYKGCTVVASYTVSQPAAIVVTPVADAMVCKNGTTTVNVSATGGTLPYTGTGAFNGIGAGVNSFTVTDANGCVGTKSLTVANGTGVAPAKPTAISSAAADASGVCGSGNFNYSISAVATATSYTWTLPSGTSIVSGAGTTAISLTPQTGFLSGNLSVAAVNSCGSSASLVKALSSLPATTGAITGPVSVTAQQTGLVYSIAAVSGLTYNWTVSGGSTILSGQGTSSITVKWGNNSGLVKVTAGNSCGTSATTSLSVTVGAAFASSSSVEITNNVAVAPTAVYPNPARDIAYVRFNADKEYKYTIEVSDLTGKPVIRTTGNTIKGTNTIHMDIHSISNGTYIVSIFNEKGERKTLKLVKE